MVKHIHPLPGHEVGVGAPVLLQLDALEGEVAGQLRVQQLRVEQAAQGREASCTTTRIDNSLFEQ